MTREVQRHARRARAANAAAGLPTSEKARVDMVCRSESFLKGYLNSEVGPVAKLRDHADAFLSVAC